MELAGKEPAMIRQFDRFDQLFGAGRLAADLQSCGFQAAKIVIVYFVAVAVTLGDYLGAIDSCSKGLLGQAAFLRAVNDNGGLSGVARSASDAMDIIQGTNKGK